MSPGRGNDRNKDPGVRLWPGLRGWTMQKTEEGLDFRSVGPGQVEEGPE